MTTANSHPEQWYCPTRAQWFDETAWETAVAELSREDHVAAAVAPEILRRPDVVAKVAASWSARCLRLVGQRNAGAGAGR
ncbi:DUF6192 family protein [Streptomyces sp. NBC_00876]|uniref:DUF6192 family protein n=1 Tax=Streptomyces sp. NBC_00876 TaxID=2975853 RepID=UPI0038705D57|nr:DUF6192 family protein [Streptomyces sp. NBC_00876]